MNNLNIRKVLLTNTVKIIDTDSGKYVIKYNKSKSSKKNLDELFKYLSGRKFTNYLDYIDSQDDFVIYPYINSTVFNPEEKSLDLIEIIGILHKKTQFIKSFPIDEIKKLYESQISNLEYIEKFYDDLRHSCEEEKYLSPSKYYFLRNSSWIFHSINSSKFFLDKWYSIMKDKKTKRVCLIHGNLELNHLLDSENKYLISWDNSRIDLPIYDLLSLYNKHFNDISFYELLKVYNSIVPMYEEEKYFLFSQILLPEKFNFSNTEIINVKDIYNIVKYLKTSTEIISNYHSSNTNSQGNQKDK